PAGPQPATDGGGARWRRPAGERPGPARARRRGRPRHCGLFVRLRRRRGGAGAEPRPRPVAAGRPGGAVGRVPRGRRPGGRRLAPSAEVAVLAAEPERADVACREGQLPHVAFRKGKLRLAHGGAPEVAGCRGQRTARTGGASGPGRAGERVPRHAAGGGGRRHRRGPALGDVSHRGAHRGGLLPRGGGARASAAARVRGGAHGRAAQGVAARPHPRPRPGAPRGGAGGRPRRSARRFRPGLAGGGGAPGRGGRGGAGRARARAAGGHHVEAGGGPQVRGGRRSSRTRVCAGSSWSTTSGSRRGRWASWRRCSSAKAPRGQRPSAGSIADARSEGDSEAAEQRVLLRRKLTAAEQELERAQEDLRASELRCEELGARAWKRRAEARELEARLEESQRRVELLEHQLEEAKVQAGRGADAPEEAGGGALGPPPATGGGPGTPAEPRAPRLTERRLSDELRAEPPQQPRQHREPGRRERRPPPAAAQGAMPCDLRALGQLLSGGAVK
ncbi:unnamed protein product, partial [Prorocentrum cordatum]